MSIDETNPQSPASAPESPAPAVPPPPRTRWAAIIWGVVFAAIAVSALVLLGDGERGEEVSDWILSLTPASITAMVLLALGAVVLICAATGLIRRVQRRAASA
jgi:hypothetical protein